MRVYKYGLIISTILTTISADSISDMFKKGEVSGELRSMYIFEDFEDSSVTDLEALAIGGKVSYQTGEYEGLSAKTTFYTSQGLGVNSSADKVGGTYLVNPANGKSFSILQEAYLEYKIANTTLKLGRQELDTPLAGPDDVRIIPNSFEAYLLINSDIKNTTIIAGHITKMAGVFDSNGDGTKFQSMSKVAFNQPDYIDVSSIVGNQGVSVLAGIYSNPDIGIDFQLWDYYAHNVVNAIYADLNYAKAINEDFGINAGVQYYSESDIGDLSDAGVKIDYSVFGLKAGIGSETKGVNLSASFNKVSNDESIYTFGAWGGYPEFTITYESVFLTVGNMRNASTCNLWLDYDFSKLNINGLNGSLIYAYFDLEDKFNNNLNLDTDVIDVVLTYAINDNLTLGALYENRKVEEDRGNSRDFLQLKAFYNF